MLHTDGSTTFWDWSDDALRQAALLLEEELEKAAPLTPRQFVDKQDKLIESTHDQLEGYASQVAAGKISPAQFRQKMTATLRTAHTASYRNGASSVNGRVALDDNDVAAVADRVGDQLDYLQGFVSDIRDANDDDQAFSDAYMTNRAGMYADALRSTFFAGQVSRYSDDEFQVWYEAEDDDNTCSPCTNAEHGSPYAPSEAPLPGSLCQGGPRCRCTLRYEKQGGSADD